MILGTDLPHGKAFFALLGLSALYQAGVTRFVLACLLCGPRLSAAAVGSTTRTDPRHRGNVIRFLRRLPAPLRQDWLEAAFGNLLADELPQGTWVFILDQTYCGHQSARMDNGYTTSPRGKRRKRSDVKDKRTKRKRQPQSYCHCFVCGLLLTPGGLRLPLYRSYYTQAYCAQQSWPYRKQTELAAALIDSLRVPDGADVMVLGDTAFDADVVLAACRRRRFGWIVAMNGDRVAAGAKPRPKITTQAATWTAQDYVPVRLTPGQGRYAAQRRSAACRTGLTRKSRHFWVHVETLDVYHVGTARVLFSTMQPVEAGRPVVVQKVLLTSDQRRSVADLIELYDLRWQIELFFKECKQTLGLARYRLRDFDAVESWVSLCLLAFVYLEWYRREQLGAGPPSRSEHRRWQWQRSHGLALAVRQEVEQHELELLQGELATADGISQLRQKLRRAIQREYRIAS